MTSLTILAETALRKVWFRQKIQAHETVSLPARKIGSGAKLMVHAIFGVNWPEAGLAGVSGSGW